MMSYLADHVIQYFEDFNGFAEWLRRMEKAGAIEKVEIDEKRKSIAIQGKVATGFYQGIDPINVLVLLGFAFFGEYWAFMSDTKQAFDKIHKWWKEQIKKGQTTDSKPKRKVLPLTAFVDTQH